MLREHMPVNHQPVTEQRGWDGEYVKQQASTIESYVTDNP